MWGGHVDEAKRLATCAEVSPLAVLRQLQAEKDEAYDRGAEDETPHYWCPACDASTAYHMPKDNHWYPERFECRCGWWQPASEYECSADLVLGMGPEAA